MPPAELSLCSRGKTHFLEEEWTTGHRRPCGIGMKSIELTSLNGFMAIFFCVLYVHGEGRWEFFPKSLFKSGANTEASSFPFPPVLPAPFPFFFLSFSLFL